jgi:hypothetical protein
MPKYLVLIVGIAIGALLMVGFSVNRIAAWQTKTLSCHGDLAECWDDKVDLELFAEHCTTEDWTSSSPTFSSSR